MQAAAPEAGGRFAHRNIHLVGAEAFDKKGGWALVCELKKQLESEGRKVYGFPSGGSNDVGTWGYVQAIAEVEQQAEATGLKFDAVYFACGSGGTAAGLALGMRDSTLGGELVGLCVDDTPQIFFDKIDGIYADLGLGGLETSSILRLEDSVGLGYAASTTAELEYVRDVARATGVVLDPVYSGKAALGMVQDLKRTAGRKRRVLFIHTGGLLGLYAKDDQLAPLLAGGWSNKTAAL